MELGFKALHVIFIVTWMCGLFYSVRLLVYHRELQEKKGILEKTLSQEMQTLLGNQYSLMERRLWFGITWPSALLATLFGLSLLRNFLPLGDHPWLVSKLLFVILLWGQHFFTGSFLKKTQQGYCHKSSQFFRLWNELTTLALVMIVFLVIMKDSASALLYGGLFMGITAALGFGFMFYRKMRRKS